jgi:hypothetical protein
MVLLNTSLIVMVELYYQHDLTIFRGNVIMLKKQGLSLACCFMLMLMGEMSTAHANLIEDLDGINISLYDDNALTNLFGPPSFVTNWMPGVFGNQLPSPMSDGTEIEVILNTSSIFIRQLVASSFDATALGWIMMFENIDWVSPSEIVSASIVTNTFQSPLSITFSVDSLTIEFDGGSTESLSVGVGGVPGNDWQALITFDVEPLKTVSAPAAGLILFLSAGLLVVRRK